MGSGGETYAHLGLHIFMILSTAPGVTQHVTGEPESTKHLKIHDLHYSPYYCKLRPRRKSSSPNVSWLVAESNLGQARHPTPLLPQSNRGGEI